MIIDTHIHVGHEKLISQEMVDFMKSRNIWEKARQRISPDGVISALDRAKIDKGIIFPLTFMPDNIPWQNMNEMTAEYVQEFPERLLGFAIIDPRNIDETIAELERCSNDLDLRGIKFHPSMQEFYPNDPVLDPVYEFCVEQNWPFLCHTGASAPTHPDKYSMPLLLDEVAVKFPDLKIIMAHTGRPFYQEAGLLLRKHKNVYGDLCANIGRSGGSLLMQGILAYIKIYADGLNKILFGSDFPIFEPADTLAQIREAFTSELFNKFELPQLSQAELDGVIGNNAAQLLGLTQIKK